MSATLRSLLGPYLAWAFRVALGVVFICAAAPKIADPLGFARNIANYHLLPDNAINALAITLPWIELCCGVALVIGLASRANLLLVNLLLSVFIVAILSAMSRGLDISCGCFSTATAAAAKMTRWTLYWDIIWLAMGLFALAFDRPVLALDAFFDRRRHAASTR